MNTIQNINLSKLNKCDQIWEDMRSCDGGKICQKCNHLIRDFRQATNEEIARAHAFSEGRVCGLYTEEQLRLRLPSKKSTWKSLYLGRIGLLYSNQVNAQEISKPPEVEQTEKKFENKQPLSQKELNKPALSHTDSCMVFGRLTDQNGNPIIYGAVLVAGSELGTTTDTSGYYYLNISPAFESKSKVQLAFHSIGYETQYKEINIEECQQNIKMDIKLIEYIYQLTDFGVSARAIPVHKRIWYRAKHLFWNGNRKHK